MAKSNLHYWKRTFVFKNFSLQVNNFPGLILIVLAVISILILPAMIYWSFTKTDLQRKIDSQNPSRWSDFTVTPVSCNTPLIRGNKCAYISYINNLKVKNYPIAGSGFEGDVQYIEGGK